MVNNDDFILRCGIVFCNIIEKLMELKDFFNSYC